MAMPGLLSVGNNVSGTAASVAVPVPGAVSSGNMVLAFIYLDGAAQTITPPDGTWTHAQNSPVNVSGGNHGVHIFWHRATGSESGTYTFTYPTSTFREGFALRYTSVVASGTPFDTGTGSAQDNTSNTVSPAVSTTSLGPDRLDIWVSSNWTGGTWTAPTDFLVERTSVEGLLVAADKNHATAGSTGSLTGSCTGNDKRTAWVGALIGTTSSGQSAAATTATEADSSIALGRAKTRLAGLPTETDTSTALARRKTRLAAQTTEADSSTAFGKRKVKPAGLTTEADTATVLARRKVKAIGTALETDAATHVGSGITQPITLAPEADLALPFGRGKARVLGVATEGSTVFGFGHSWARTVGTALESETASPATTALNAWRLIAPTVTEKYPIIGSLVTSMTRQVTVFGDENGLFTSDQGYISEGGDDYGAIPVNTKYIWLGGHINETTDPAIKALWLANGFEVQNV